MLEQEFPRLQYTEVKVLPIPLIRYYLSGIQNTTHKSLAKSSSGFFRVSAGRGMQYVRRTRRFNYFLPGWQVPRQAVHS